MQVTNRNSGMRVDVVTINPTMAARWLERNVRNRPVNVRHVRELAGAMSRGEWRMNAETIKFSDADTLIDGQHRLRAIIAADKPVTMMVVWGISVDAFDTMDQGAKRTAGHILTIAGEKDATHLAATARLYLILKQRPEDPDFHFSPSPKEIEKGIAQNPDLRQAVHVGKRLSKVSTTSVAGAIWLRFREKNPTMADEFMDRLADGANLPKNHPIKTLRDALMVNRISTRKFGKRETIAGYIKAWNAFRSGKDMKILRVSSEESLPTIA